MPVLKEQIAQRVKGQLGETEDWWHLCYDTEKAAFYVEHSWSHTNAYKVSKGTDAGSEQHQLEGWNGPGSEKLAEAQAKLEERARS